jgi:ribonuclease VapC
MVVDSSMLIAIILKEAGFEDFVFRLAEADRRLISAASYLEASIVLLKRRDPGIELELDRLIYELNILIVPVNAGQARTARQAFMSFGKGRHAARLNFGDCFAYALAKHESEPLLFKGEDFNKTDIEVA